MEKLELVKRQGKKIQIIEKFDSKKDYKIPIRKQVVSILSELEKGKEYRLVELVEKYDGVITRIPENPITGRGGRVSDNGILVEAFQIAFVAITIVILAYEKRKLSVKI